MHRNFNSALKKITQYYKKNKWEALLFYLHLSSFWQVSLKFNRDCSFIYYVGNVVNNRCSSWKSPYWCMTVLIKTAVAEFGLFDGLVWPPNAYCCISIVQFMLTVLCTFFYALSEHICYISVVSWLFDECIF